MGREFGEWGLCKGPKENKLVRGTKRTRAKKKAVEDSSQSPNHLDMIGRC